MKRDEKGRFVSTKHRMVTEPWPHAEKHMTPEQIEKIQPVVVSCSLGDLVETMHGKGFATEHFDKHLETIKTHRPPRIELDYTVSTHCPMCDTYVELNTDSDGLECPICHCWWDHDGRGSYLSEKVEEKLGITSS